MIDDCFTGFGKTACSVVHNFQSYDSSDSSFITCWDKACPFNVGLPFCLGRLGIGSQPNLPNLPNLLMCFILLISKAVLFRFICGLMSQIDRALMGSRE
jgi:hypothetical protein